MPIRLDERLTAAANLAAGGATVCDVGCDHGTLACYIVQTGRAERAIATDISAPSLKKAERLAEELGLTDLVETRVGDGLDPVADGEADVVVLAGMGGAAAVGGMAQNMVGGAGQEPRAELVDVVSGDHFELIAPRCVVGRERASADIVLRDPNVSRRHAELTLNGTSWTIEDLNSTNGISVNNRRVTRWPLHNGDLVTFGLTTLEFRG